MIAILIIAIAGSGCLEQTSIDNGDIKPENQDIPESLDQYYTAYPPEYLLKMFELSESMVGITVNIQQGDMENAAESFKTFSEDYSDNAQMVPEWQDYYNQTAVEDLGAALDAEDIPGVYKAIEEVGGTCAVCHKDTMPPVWIKYSWQDFRTVDINTPEGPLPWRQAKMMYVQAGFDGIGVNIKEGDQPGVNQSFALFESMFDNMAKACDVCHISEPRYYVSEDITGMIETMGQEINAGNLTSAEGIRQGIGAQSCHRCHVLHVPAQYAKEGGN